MLSYGYYENINGKLRGRVTKGNIEKKVALLEYWKLRVRSAGDLKAWKLATTAATTAVLVLGTLVLGIPVMRALA
jgi:predicted lipid-binding transport protein (Tim44 family)